MIETLQPAFRDRLASMYAGEPQFGVELLGNTKIHEEAGMWLHDLCVDLEPQKTLEVGMAYGFSTLYILAAAKKLGFGFHVAIDPLEEAAWHNVGVQNVADVGMQNSFMLFVEPSFSALPSLKAHKFNLIFIDGNHRFDDVLVDFTLAAELLPVGGSIVFDDLWMPSVRTVVSFIRSNRKDFQERQSPEGWAHFRRVGQDTRLWDHFVDFSPRTSIQHRIVRRVKRAFVSFQKYRPSPPQKMA